MSKIENHKELIKELAELLDQSSLTEIEVEEEDLRIRVARAAPVTNTPVYTAPVPASGAPPVAPSLVPTTVSSSEHTVDAKPTSAGTVTAPMVGTLYASAAPGENPFIQIGDKINKGDTILIIEAMKVMNQIPAPHSGTVKAIHFQDGQPVEFGEALCVID